MDKSTYEKIIEFEKWYQDQWKLVEEKIEEIKKSDFILTDKNDNEIDII